MAFNVFYFSLIKKTNLQSLHVTDASSPVGLQEKFAKENFSTSSTNGRARLVMVGQNTA